MACVMLSSSQPTVKRGRFTISEDRLTVGADEPPRRYEVDRQA